MKVFFDVLLSFVGGRGEGASGAVVHFFLPCLFWFLLAVIIVRELRRTKERKAYELKLEERQQLERINSALEERISGMVADLERRAWFNSGENELNAILRGEKSSAELGDRVLGFLIGYLEAGAGALYLYDEQNELLTVISTFALSGAKRLNESVAPGEGLAGQVAREKKMIHIHEVPYSYLPISSALGEADPLDVVVVPVMNDGQLVGVIEMGSFKQFNPDMIEFLSQSMEGIAIAFSGIRSRELLHRLLEQTREQADELRIQQEELRQSNEELQERSLMLEQMRGTL